ncbi:MAG: hypothetical protein ACI955_001395 [Zhongshania sp.]
MFREQSQQSAIGSPELDGFTNTSAGESGFDISAHGDNLDTAQTQFTDDFRFWLQVSIFRFSFVFWIRTLKSIQSFTDLMTGSAD